MRDLAKQQIKKRAGASRNYKYHLCKVDLPNQVLHLTGGQCGDF